MKIDFEDKNLDQKSITEITKLIALKPEKGFSDLEFIWYLMDWVWDEIGCGNEKMNLNKMAEFYSHPVWLLNGLFIEQDEESMRHRHAISDWIVQKQLKCIIDYGGGFGTLAKLISMKNEKALIDIYEPFPSDYSLNIINEYAHIFLTDQLSKQYDCLVSTDVLEHVYNPLETLSDMISCLKVGGYLVIANCFLPVIKCHLPQNLHLNYTFSLFARMMGMAALYNIKGSHAMVYKKVNVTSPDWQQIRYLEKLSKSMYPFAEAAKKIYRRIRKR